MFGSLYLAWRYLCYHKVKTAILVASITLVVYLPAGLNVLVDQSAAQLRQRATMTPLIVGAKGSALELVLNSLYFESKQPAVMQMGEIDRVRNSTFAEAIPLYVRFRAGDHPIVGTSFDYFDFRKLRIASGHHLATLGDCVVGAAVAETLQLKPGSSITSTPENPFDLAGVYPLKMHVVGILAPSGSPDDSAIFVDVKTAWVIEGLGHGHQDLASPESSSLLLSREGNQLTANAAVVQYNEITPENVGSFHFHGDMAKFPITAVLAVPHDQKSMTLLMGRYQSADDVSQIVRPSAVMDGLLATVLKVRSFMLAGALLVGLAAVLTAVLVFVLSLQLREREIATMAKIGCARYKLASMLACEVLVVLVAGGAIAAAMAAATSQFGVQAIRWFLL